MQAFDDAACIFLGLGRLKGVGFKRLRELGSVDTIASQFATGGRDFVEALTRDKATDGIEEEVFRRGVNSAEVLQARGIRLVRQGEPEYPLAFNDLAADSQPLWFFYRGDIGLTFQKCVAVVGTRAPSDTGTFLTKYAVSTLRDLGIPTVSGLARGVDEIAHEWSLATGLPTISVMATGLLRTYPAANETLADKIVHAGGLLISEYLPHATPTAENFVWRNRLQAALGQFVIAPEWKPSSGTAHTIRFAKAMGRPTINLVIQGDERAELGQADSVYRVPAEHGKLVEQLSADRPPSQPAIYSAQAELFAEI